MKWNQDTCVRISSVTCTNILTEKNVDVDWDRMSQPGFAPYSRAKFTDFRIT